MTPTKPIIPLCKMNATIIKKAPAPKIVAGNPSSPLLRLILKPLGILSTTNQPQALKTYHISGTEPCNLSGSIGQIRGAGYWPNFAIILKLMQSKDCLFVS